MYVTSSSDIQSRTQSRMHIHVYIVNHSICTTVSVPHTHPFSSLVSSVQDCIYVLQKAHMLSTAPLRSLPNDASKQFQCSSALQCPVLHKETVTLKVSDPPVPTSLLSAVPLKLAFVVTFPSAATDINNYLYPHNTVIYGTGEP